MVCCIKKFPLDPVGACGATASNGARQQMHDVLAVEIVPHYRTIAETSLDALEEDTRD